VFCLAASLAACGKGLARSPRRSHGIELTYRSGPVMGGRTTSYAIFWVPPGHILDPRGDQRFEQIVERYLRDVGGTRYYGILTQYSHASDGSAVFDGPILNASALGGVWIDRRAYPGGGGKDHPLHLADVQDEIKRAIRVNHWRGGLQHEFFVLLASNAYACDLEGYCTYGLPYTDYTWCGLHYFFPAFNQPVIYGVVADAALTNCSLDPYIGFGTPDDDPVADAVLPILSHEQFEMVSDPMFNGWSVQKRLPSEEAFPEMADLCFRAWTEPDRRHATVYLHGRPYQLPDEWSNGARGCTTS
jgi:hypothetical protein